MGKRRKTDLNAELLAVFRKSGMTRYELAKRANVPYSSIHLWVAGTRGITLDTASKVADVLGVRFVQEGR